MIFSSPIFLYLFLPIVLLGYYLSLKKVKNYWLLLASLIFFAWGGVSYTIILIFSIILNYIFGILIESNKDSKKSYWWAFLGVACNILILGIFKYANFITHNLNLLFHVVHFKKIPETNIALPIGISFYTFHLLSYLIDIYKGKTLAQRNIFDLALYVCMFSQLIAGPIIRYSDVWQQLLNRQHSLSMFVSGVERFIIGLSKKVLLSNVFASVADPIFSSPPENLTALNSWLGIISYTFQIYCDFAGYSDMAIGLGRMFGFDFKENFNFPYMANSVKDFWRRWHISLSSFFRDYVYIPLGGNRVNISRVYVNLFVVFLLTGFWHGASWNFVVWGLFHGFFMILERFGFEKVLHKIFKPVAVVYTFFIVMMAWILFRADSLDYAIRFYKALFNFNIHDAQLFHFMKSVTSEYILVLIITVFGAFGFFEFVRKKVFLGIKSNKLSDFMIPFFQITVYGVLLLLCTSYLLAGTYNPFIYYRF